MSNSIEDILNGNKSSNSSAKEETKKKKIALIRDKMVLYIKELKYPISLTASLLILVSLSNQTLFNEESEFKASNLYGEGKEELVNMETSSVAFVKSSKQLEAEISSVEKQIQDKKTELDNANATITNLTQGYFFIAYLDSLFNKHGITLDRFDINLSNTGIKGTETGVLTLDNLVDMKIPKGDYSLLPLDIEFTTTSENLRLLFDEFYTRRIVYDKDLKIINNLDSTVTVKTKIEFTNSTVVADGENTANVTAPTTPVTPDATMEQLTPSTGVDDWDLSSSGSTGATSTNNAGDTSTLYENNTPSTDVFDGE